MAKKRSNPRPKRDASSHPSLRGLRRIQAIDRHLELDDLAVEKLLRRQEYEDFRRDRWADRLAASDLRMLEAEDRRHWRPDDGLAPARTFTGRPAGIKASAPRAHRGRGFFPRLEYPSFGVSFSAPWKVLVCVRRKVRREVLHALRFVGKGTGGGRHRRNQWSGVRC